MQPMLCGLFQPTEEVCAMGPALPHQPGWWLFSQPSNELRGTSCHLKLPSLSYSQDLSILHIECAIQIIYRLTKASLP